MAVNCYLFHQQSGNFHEQTKRFNWSKLKATNKNQFIHRPKVNLVPSQTQNSNGVHEKCWVLFHSKIAKIFKEFFRWICRYSGPLAEGFTDSTHQSITGSYVDFSRDYYTPNIQNASNFLIQSTLHRGETPTYVWSRVTNAHLKR